MNLTIAAIDLYGAKLRIGRNLQERVDTNIKSSVTPSKQFSLVHLKVVALGLDNYES
jgi:hypothetical protein